MTHTGIRCLFCRSAHIAGESYAYESGFVSQDVGCLACGERWLDVFELVAVSHPDWDSADQPAEDERLRKNAESGPGAASARSTCPS